MNNNNGRELLPWSEEIWSRIDKAVHDEAARTDVASKFLPIVGPLGPITTIQSDTIRIPDPENDGERMSVEEFRVTPLFELSSEFVLTPQQVEHEATWMTAVTLAAHSTNLLLQVKETAIYGGEQELANEPLFNRGIVSRQSGSAGDGLLHAAGLGDNQTIDVPLVNNRNQIWGENTFNAVAEAYSSLQSGQGVDQ